MDKAGATMNEVVAAIRRVTDIVAEISAASSEQSSGVSQVGEAVTQMDQATQQNAALVEQMAAAASSLKGQAEDLVQSVAVFRLAAGNTVSPVSRAPLTTPKRTAAAAVTAPKPKVPARIPAKPLTRQTSTVASAPKPVKGAAGASDDWESF